MAAIPVSVFGQVLEPGKEFHLDVFNTARLNSVALDDTATAGTSSVVKIKFIETSPDFSDSDDDSDDEKDEDDSSSDEDGVEKEIVLAHLKARSIDYQALDITLPIGQTFTFTVSGSNNVHLLGQYIELPNMYPDSADDHDRYAGYDDFDDEDDVEMGSDDDDEDDENDSSDEEDKKAPKIQEIVNKSSTNRKEPPAAKPAKAEAKKAPVAEKDTASDDEAPVDSSPDKSGLSKSQKKRLAKKAKKESQSSVGEKKPNGAEKRPAEQPSKGADMTKKPSNRTVHPSGLIVENKSEGSGQTAQAGRKISMRYIGRLQSGKVFDSNLKGKPLTFTLGKGQVIKGWDEGLKGLALGGERRLTIPPQLAYGKRGVEGIPGNSTLVFDVKLLDVK